VHTDERANDPTPFHITVVHSAFELPMLFALPINFRLMAVSPATFSVCASTLISNGCSRESVHLRDPKFSPN
jgi:hypothetical protein